MNTQTLIGDIVKERPSMSRIFEKLDIDYCCGGSRPLEEACGDKGLDAATVLAVLEAVNHDYNSSNGFFGYDDVASLSAPELIDHIVTSHHHYLRRELPRLTELAAKVASGHGDRNPALVEVENKVIELRGELESHLQEEELNVFPAIREGGVTAASLDELRHDHRAVGELLAAIRSLTDTYAVPEWGCNTYRAFMDGLRELEEDIHQHVHKENNVLFAMSELRSTAQKETA